MKYSEMSLNAVTAVALLCFVFIFSSLLPSTLFADENEQIALLKKQIESLEKKIATLEARLKETAGSRKKKTSKNIEETSSVDETAEIERLRMEARIAAQSGTSAETTDSIDKVFKGGERAQQALNPEISITGDFLSTYMFTSPHYKQGLRSGNLFRVAGIHIQSEMDPFTFGKFCLEATEGGLELGEAYATFSNMLPGASVTLGKFRQLFGVVNRWHLPGLDQSTFPLALTTILGPDGLNQKGVSIDYNFKHPWASANELTLQITNAENNQLFCGPEYGPIPAVLLHLKNFHELSADKYFEWGMTAMTGPNNKYGVLDAAGNTVNEERRNTRLYGFDMTYFKEPVNRAHYSNFTWRTELYRALKEVAGGLEIDCAGGYTCIQKKLDEKWEAGLRYDYTQPFALANNGQHLTQIVPYINYWQSPWVRTRLEFARLDGTTMAEPENRVNLQVTWSMGPHKHERY